MGGDPSSITASNAALKILERDEPACPVGRRRRHGSPNHAGVWTVATKNKLRRPSSYMILRLFILVFVFLSLAKVVVVFRRWQLRRGPLILWGLLWLGIAVVALVPDLSSRLAEYVGIGRGADLVVYGSILFLFYAVFRLVIKQSYLEREIADLAGITAIREAQKKYDQNSR